METNAPSVCQLSTGNEDPCKNFVCPASGDQCSNPGTCDSSTGLCRRVPKPDQTFCSDSNIFTVNDVCIDGVCQGQSYCANTNCSRVTAAETSIAFAACHTTATCDHLTRTCSMPPDPNFQICDDGNEYTTNDNCFDGYCVGTCKCPAPQTSFCQTNGDLCNIDGFPEVGICNQDGVCIPIECPTPGSSCDDGNAATVNDVCKDYVCQGTDLCAAVTCPNRTQCFQRGVCNPQTGFCEYEYKVDGTYCDDQDPETPSTTCVSGICGTENPCTGYSCRSAGQCQVLQGCDSSTGRCQYENKEDGILCSDYDVSTLDDVCISGACVGVNPCLGFTCPVMSPCVEKGVCVPTLQPATAISSSKWVPKCSYASRPDGYSNVNCTSGCYDGVCKSSNPCESQHLDCDIVVPHQCYLYGSLKCDDDISSSTYGQCVSRFPVQNGSECDDGNGATFNDVCIVDNTTSIAKCVGELDLCFDMECPEVGQCHIRSNCISSPADPYELVEKKLLKELEFQSKFDRYDRNYDRVIDASELMHYFVARFAAVARTHTDAGVVQNPTITIIQFEQIATAYFVLLFSNVCLLPCVPGMSKQEATAQSIVLADANGDNVLSLAEYKDAMKPIISWAALRCPVPGNAEDGKPCDDGDEQTPQDSCQNGLCQEESESASSEPMRFLDISSMDGFENWFEGVMKSL